MVPRVLLSTYRSISYKYFCMAFEWTNWDERVHQSAIKIRTNPKHFLLSVWGNLFLFLYLFWQSSVSVTDRHLLAVRKNGCVRIDIFLSWPMMTYHVTSAITSCTLMYMVFWKTWTTSSVKIRHISVPLRRKLSLRRLVYAWTMIQDFVCLVTTKICLVNTAVLWTLLPLNMGSRLSGSPEHVLLCDKRVLTQNQTIR